MRQLASHSATVAVNYRSDRAAADALVGELRGNGVPRRLSRPMSATRPRPASWSARWYPKPAADRFRPSRPRRHEPRAPAGAAVEPARRVGHLQAPGACGAGQRGRFDRLPGHGRAARPGRPRCPPVPAGRAAGLRPVRAAAGVSLVQRQARLPVPPRLVQRHPARLWQGEERVRARGPDPPALGHDRHPARRPCRYPARGNRSPVQVTGPDGTAALIDQLRADGVVLSYDPDDRALRSGGHDPLSITIGTDNVSTHSRQNKKRRIARKTRREHPLRPEAERR